MSREVREVNSMWFDLSKPDGLKLMNNFIQSLIQQNQNNSNQRYVIDFLVKCEDCSYYVVDFIQRDLKNEIGGEFVYKNFEEEIYQEIYLPDKTYVWIPASLDPEKYIVEWVNEEHPGEYAKNDFGWYNVKEQEAYNKMMKNKKETK